MLEVVDMRTVINRNTRRKNKIAKVIAKTPTSKALSRQSSNERVQINPAHLADFSEDELGTTRTGVASGVIAVRGNESSYEGIQNMDDNGIQQLLNKNSGIVGEARPGKVYTPVFCCGRGFPPAKRSYS